MFTLKLWILTASASTLLKYVVSSPISLHLQSSKTKPFNNIYQPDLMIFAPLSPSEWRFKRTIPPNSYGVEPQSSTFGESSAGEAGYRGPYEPPKKPTTDLSQTQENNVDGSFSYRYVTDNGITAESKGYQLPKDGGQAMAGQYSYTAPDGTLVVTRWWADETGFHAEGPHISGISRRS